jgi:hypothetical protein
MGNQVASWLWPRRIERSPNDQKSGDGTVRTDLLEVVAVLKVAIGHPNMAEFWQATQRAATAAELEAAIQPVLSETGLM